MSFFDEFATISQTSLQLSLVIVHLVLLKRKNMIGY